jgi:ABC-type multidrug transport system ATPase subunit
MEKSVKTQAQELKDLIEKMPFSGQINLQDFAEKFSTDPLLHHQALNLEVKYNESQMADEREKLRPTIFNLIDTIVEEYIENTDNQVIASVKNPLQDQLKANLNAAKEEHIVFEGKNIGKKFKKNGFYLQGIDLQLKTGEITGVVGENGNGKTTLFRICVGDLEHSEGEIRYPDLGEVSWNKINWYKTKKHIAFIPQELPKWHGSLYNNLSLEATLHGFKGKANQPAVEEMLERFDLKEHLDKSWAELSGGYKLRFALAKALISHPRLLVIDEPLANLDINAQTVILNGLKNLIESRIFPVAIMISSQHLHEIERVADNLLYLKNGQEMYNGKTGEFGKERLENCFELDCDLSQAVFEQLLKGFAYNSVQHNGLVLIVRTPLHIQEKDLLQFLLAKEVKINYFRNISQSIKKYFV